MFKEGDTSNRWLLLMVPSKNFTAKRYLVFCLNKRKKLLLGDFILRLTERLRFV